MNDLLKVLDMSEDEQYNWLWQHSATFGFDLKWIDFSVPSAYAHSVKKEIAMHLADLAFRLRDETLQEGNATNWQRAMDLVFITVNPPYKSEYKLSRWSAVTYWFSHVSKPIHWIIAALIAKEQK